MGIDILTLALARKGDSSGDAAATEPYVKYKIENGYITEAAFYGFTKIPSHMFYAARANSGASKDLTKVDFSGSPDLKEIKESAFFNSAHLELSELPSGLDFIRENAFQGCDGITIEAIPKGVVVFDKAFYGCDGIERLEISASALYDNCFGLCSNLKSVWIRKTCETIAFSTSTSSASKAPFAGCSDDLVIYVEGSNKYNWHEYFNRTGSSGATTATVIYGQTECPW